MNEDELENIESGEAPKKSGDAGEEGADAAAAGEGQEEEKDEGIKLKTRPVPAVVMLLGGAAVAIDVTIQGFPMWKALLCILISLIVFLIIGDIVKMFLDRIRIPRPVEETEAGENGEELTEGEGGEPGEGEEAGASREEEAPVINENVNTGGE